MPRAIRLDAHGNGTYHINMTNTRRVTLISEVVFGPIDGPQTRQLWIDHHDIAINHSPEAVALHLQNYPSERQMPEAGALDLLWWSPTCAHADLKVRK